ncbi:type III PLP-dependent enzyme [Mangrovibacillus cuniculi]|nr:type III PLP-dependent enzyme [Mangrovibacillus cuniculi]
MQEIVDIVTKHAKKEPACAYVYDLKFLKAHVERMKESLPANCQLFYAMKANPDDKIIQTLSPVVDGFEIASRGELERVSSYVNNQIIFGGPGKKDEEIRQLIQTNVCLINVESVHDLHRIAYLAEHAGTQAPVMLRVNLNRNVSESKLKMSGVPTQFGIEEDDIPQVIAEALSHPSLELKGFHFHAMSNNLDAHAHIKFVDLCLELSHKWQCDFAISAPIVDVGGGIGINYWNPREAFDWDLFADGLREVVERHASLTIILEIGRFMTAECGFYVTEVLDVKENHGEVFVVLRGGTHHLRLPAAWKMSHPFVAIPVDKWSYPFERPGVQGRKVNIVGELCTPNDVLVRQESVEEVRAGDLIVFTHAGAYAWTISHHDFLSHPYPEVFYLE